MNRKRREKKKCGQFRRREKEFVSGSSCLRLRFAMEQQKWLVLVYVTQLSVRSFRKWFRVHFVSLCVRFCVAAVFFALLHLQPNALLSYLSWVCNVHTHVPVDGFVVFFASPLLLYCTTFSPDFLERMKTAHSRLKKVATFLLIVDDSTRMEKVSDDTYTRICSQCKRNKNQRKIWGNSRKKQTKMHGKVRLQLSMNESLKKRRTKWNENVVDKMLNAFYNSTAKFIVC